jgi:hypothetical protein
MKRALPHLFLLIPFLAAAQPGEPGNWLIYFGDKRFNEKWNWHSEVQYRNFNLLGDTEQLLLRTGFGYNLTENNNNVHLGYAFIYSEPYLPNSDQKISFNEHRIYQQFITRQTFGRFSIQHRYRFEQRFFDEDFKLRLRYFLSFNVAVNHKTMQDKTIYLSVYNEIFLNTDNPVFDRNRLYGGLGYRLNRHFRGELGLMNQATSFWARNQLNVIAFVNF